MIQVWRDKGLHRVAVNLWLYIHHSDVIIGAVASEITILTIVYSTVYSSVDQGKDHWPLCGEFTGQMASNAEMFPFDDVIMLSRGSSVHIDGLVTVGDRTVALNIIARCSITQTPTGQWNIDNVSD